MSQNANRRNRRKPTPTDPTAAEAYAARRADIARLLDVLGMELERMDTDAKAKPGDWGFPGSLGKVRSDLIELAGFLSNKDPEEVEAFLNDAE
jgi:hypothetical protein